MEGRTKSGIIEKQFRTLDKGWSWVIMLASFGVCCILGGNIYGVGIIQSSLLERYGESVSLTSWAGSLHTAFMCLGAPLSSMVLDTFSCRTAVMLSGLLYAVGYLTTAFAPNIGTAIFSIGIVAGFGGGLGYTATVAVIGFNFKRRRRFAFGFAMSGIGVGVFALAPLMQLARDYYGIASFFIVQAMLSLNVITFGATFFPSQLEIHAKEIRKAGASLNDSKVTFKHLLRSYCKVLLIKPVIFLSVGLFLNYFGIYLIIVHLPSYVKSKGFSEMQAVFIVSLMGIVSVAGRLLTGIIASLKRLKDIWIYSLTMGIVSASAIAYPYMSDTFAGHIGFAVVLGLFFGSSYVLLATVNVYFVGIHYMPAAIGFELFLGGIGSMLGPVCTGILVDNGGTYGQSITFAGVCIMFASIVSGLTVCFKPASDESATIKEEAT